MIKLKVMFVAGYLVSFLKKKKNHAKLTVKFWSTVFCSGAPVQSLVNKNRLKILILPKVVFIVSFYGFFLKTIGPWEI